MKFCSFIFVYFLLSFPKYSAQVNLDFSSEIKFISHLVNNNENKNAIYLLRKIDQGNLRGGQLDSLNYVLGWAYYNRKVTDTSALFFNKVSAASPFYLKSKFYEAFDHTYQAAYDPALNILNEIPTDSNETNKQLKLLETAGISLLQKNYTKFDSLSLGFNYDYYATADQQKDLVSYAAAMRKYKRRSPLAAGLLSTLLPGAGKFYAGKKGQGLAAFFTCAVLGAVAGENIYKTGIKSPQSIIFGSIFSMFYIGNIWGSVLSVKMSKQSFYRTKQDEILLTIHIPLRRVFSE